MNTTFIRFFCITTFLLISTLAPAQTIDELNDNVFKYFRLGDYKTAIEYCEKLVTKAKTELGESDPVYTSMVNNLAFLYFKNGDYEKAKPVYEYVIKKQAEKVTLSKADFLIAINNMASCGEKTNDYEPGIIAYSVLSEYYKKENGEQDVSYLKAQNKLGYAYKNKGDYKNAEIVFLNIIKIKTEPDADYSDALIDLANLYDNMGLYLKSEAAYLKAIEMRRVSTGENTALYAQALNNMAFLYFHMGNFQKSETTYLRALKIRKEVLGEDHYLYASSLNNLAGLYQTIGEYAKAEALFKQALQIRKNSLGETHELYAGSLNNLATLYFLMGNYDKCIPLYLQSKDLYKTLLGDKHPDYANSLNNLAEVYKAVGGSYSTARDLFLEAIEIQKDAYGENNLRYAYYLNNLAELYTNKGYYSKAEPLLLKSLEICKNIVGEFHPDYALALNNLAVLYHSIDNYAKAKTFYIQALEIRKKTLGENHMLYASTLANLASLYTESEELLKADSLFNQSRKIILKNIKKNFAFMSETEKLSYSQTVSNELKLCQNFYLNYKKTTPSIAAQAFENELAMKGMIINSGIQMRQTILNSKNDSALNIYDEWVAVKSSLAKQYALPEDKRTIDISMEENKANDLEKKLSIISSSFKESKSLLNTSWTDIEKKLRPNEVAIEFASIQCNNGKKWIDSFIYVAMVLRKGDKSPKMVSLCEARKLEALLKKEDQTDDGFISGIYRGSELLNSTIDVSNGKLLYQLIWKPIDSLLKKGSTIYFAPSGILHQVSFAAIPYNETTLLSDRYKLNQVSTTAIILRPSKFTDTIPQNLVAFGGIKYLLSETELIAAAQKEKTSTDYVSRTLPENKNQTVSWNYLPGTLLEANAIIKIASQKNTKVKLYSGEAAVEESFKNLSGTQSPRVIHIATHGFFFPDNKNETGSTTEEKKNFRISEDPLNRAGILFSGANLAWNGTPVDEVEDGILTAYEACNVTLTNTQLIVLSACETGLGEIKGSEGVFGLQRAFKSAGTEYIMMSLWKVPDSETAEFMSQFYTLLFGGKSIQDAFHGAQNFMKIKYPTDPYKWAAFVLVR